jgi:crotonobetainyl-CoA:carnitine CoA-transferase CaiB-like acyl-CoA transferase
MNGPLEGLRVLDLSRVLAGPYCTMVLGDLGAEVIKVERPGAGDDLRGWGPPFGPTGDSTYYYAANRNKRGIAIDLATEEGRETVRRIARSSDVVVENFRVGMLDAMGLGLSAMREENPKLVTCSITAYGSEGPWAQRPGYDVMIQAMSGLMSVTGEPDGRPMRVGVAIVDLATGIYAATAILAALRARETSGQGQHVDLSLLESSLAILPNLVAGYLIDGEVPARHGTGHPNATPYGVFETRDSHVVLAIGNDTHWRKLCIALGHPEVADDVRLTRMADRMTHRVEVESNVRDWCAALTSAELSALLTEHDVPHGPVNTVPEILAHEQVVALGLVEDRPLAPGITAPGLRAPFRFSTDERTEHLPPPAVGADTDAILSGLGFSPAEIDALRAAGALG